MTRNRWLVLGMALTALSVGLYATVRSAAGNDAPRPMTPAPAPSSPAAAPPAQSSAPRQYFHFVVDGVSYKSGDELGKVKRIEIEYKGDGLVPDLAKTVMALATGGESEKTMDAADVGKLLQAAVGAQTAPGPCTATMESAGTVLPPVTCSPSPVSETTPANGPAPVQEDASKKPSRPKGKSKAKPEDSN
jgi:hypothetical protein